MWLSPGGKPGGQTLGQICSNNFLLRHAQVVRHAIEGNDPGFGVEHGKCSSPVAIAGLSHGAGIDEIAAIFAKRPIRGLGLAHSAISGTVSFTDLAREHESALKVGVSEERDGNGIGDERGDGVAGADHVFILVERRAVDELDAGEFVEADGTLRQRAEPVKIFGGELVARPERGQAGDGIEFFEAHEAADGFVVIAPDEDTSDRLRFGNDFVRIAAVANSVAKIDDQVVSGGCGQTGVERFEVAVNVAYKKDAHRGRIIAFLGGNGGGALFQFPVETRLAAFPAVERSGASA